MLTSYLRIGERTEVELPGALLAVARPSCVGTPLTCRATPADGSTTFVLSSWEGNTWLTVNDAGTLETRRWLDGDMLVSVRPFHVCHAV